MYKINLRDNYMCKITPNEWHVPKISPPPPDPPYPPQWSGGGGHLFQECPTLKVVPNVKCCEIISFLLILGE
jgi:hypothetical protein